jgi:hypothetical protein
MRYAASVLAVVRCAAGTYQMCPISARRIAGSRFMIVAIPSGERSIVDVTVYHSGSSEASRSATHRAMATSESQGPYPM